jgi:predicted Fe-Mo cluster-binding NifX family protein
VPYNIALTSSDGNQIDLHFGHADFFYVLRIDEGSGAWKILEKKKLPASSVCSGGENCNTGCAGNRHENMTARITAITELLTGCKYLLTAKIGPKPGDLLRRAGITALESPPDVSAAVSKLNKYHLKYEGVNKEK